MYSHCGGTDVGGHRLAGKDGTTDPERWVWTFLWGVGGT